MGTRKVYGYARVSSRGQAEEGLSLEAQEARIRAYAAAKGWELTEVLVERGRSAKDLKRPEMTRLMREVRSGSVEAVIILKVDRVSRSTRDLLNLLEEFEQHKTGFVSVIENIDTSSSMGRFVITLLGSLAQLEREQVGERTSFALRHARREGKAYCRTAPFGWVRKGDSFVADTTEQRFLAAARKMRAHGLSWQAIANWLESQGARPHGGKKWYPATVRQVLNSKMAQESAA
jgi:site-specific DNA recombinase